MPNIPTLFPAEVIDCEPPSPPVDGYFIVAHWRGNERPKIFDMLYDTEYHALEEARRLANGWQHRKVIHLKWGPE